MLFGRFYPPSHIDPCTIPPAVRLAESPSSLPRHLSPHSSVPSARAAGAFDRLRRPRWLSLSKPPRYVVLLKSHPSGVNDLSETSGNMARGRSHTPPCDFCRQEDARFTFYLLPLTFSTFPRYAHTCFPRGGTRPRRYRPASSLFSIKSMFRMDLQSHSK